MQLSYPYEPCYRSLTTVFPKHAYSVVQKSLLKAFCSLSFSGFAYGAEANVGSRLEPDEVVEGGDHVWSAESPAAVAARRVVAAEGRRRRQQRRESDARSGRIAEGKF